MLCATLPMNFNFAQCENALLLETYAEKGQYTYILVYSLIIIHNIIRIFK